MSDYVGLWVLRTEVRFYCEDEMILTPANESVDVGGASHTVLLFLVCLPRSASPESIAFLSSVIVT